MISCRTRHGYVSSDIPGPELSRIYRDAYPAEGSVPNVLLARRMKYLAELLNLKKWTKLKKCKNMKKCQLPTKECRSDVSIAVEQPNDIGWTLP